MAIANIPESRKRGTPATYNYSEGQLISGLRLLYHLNPTAARSGQWWVVECVSCGGIRQFSHSGLRCRELRPKAYACRRCHETVKRIDKPQQKKSMIWSLDNTLCGMYQVGEMSHTTRVGRGTEYRVVPYYHTKRVCCGLERVTSGSAIMASRHSAGACKHCGKQVDRKEAKPTGEVFEQAVWPAPQEAVRRARAFGMGVDWRLLYRAAGIIGLVVFWV